MKYNIPNSYLTALITAYRRTFSDIPFSKEIFLFLIQYLKSLGKAYRIPAELKKVNRSILIEARYKAINALIEEMKVDQFIEIAPGFSPRGFLMTQSSPSIRYVEVDLQPLILLKRQVIKYLQKIRAKEDTNHLHIQIGNALNFKDLNKVTSYLDDRKPIIILNEGLLGYLTLKERKLLARNIFQVLKIFGGVWITPDILWGINGDKKESISYLENLEQNTRSNIKSNQWQDEREAKKFFHSSGFDVEAFSFGEVVNNLTSPKNLDISLEDVEQTMNTSVVFVMKIRE